MKFYGIVNKIKIDHKPGVYGRRNYNEQEIETIEKSDEDFFSSIGSFFSSEPTKKITLQQEDPNGNYIVIDHALLEGNFNIDQDTDLFYGLFDKYLLKESAFETLMKSQGGSVLIIVERDKIPTFMHYGGESGKFNFGLYCPHPKRDDILFPIDGYSNLIKNMILEETLRAYEALGAKSISIEDLTDLKMEGSYSQNGASVKGNVSLNKEVLREKTFGKGVFDPNRALKNSMFIHDLPNVMTTVKARIHGNQLVEKFSETVNLSVGLDVGVIEAFSSTLKVDYHRKWKIEVVFYDKNDIQVSNNLDNSILNINLDIINRLSEKVKYIFKNNTLSQIEIGLSVLTEEDLRVLNSLSDQQKNILLDEIIELTVCDGKITAKELEFILSICDKLKLDINKAIQDLSANYLATLFFLKQSAVEVNDMILFPIPVNNYKAQFYKNNRIFLFDSSDKIVAKGTYQNGGRKIVLDGGKIAESPNIYKNIISLIK
jgi:hypothetical protein